MIDFRSDTVTQPCEKMRKAIAAAAVGDDVYGDDPSVSVLESWAAERHQFEAALFCSSGTQANLLALLAHCQRGDEYLCGQQAHNYRYEGGGAAILGSIQPQPIENEPDGSLCFDKLKAAVKPDDFHYAQTKLLSLENTISGQVLTLDYLKQVRTFVDEHKLSLHLDGARVYNAAVALNVDITEITQYFDSVSICLSKGLGAPVGSLLLGSNHLINSARRWRKMLGGGMRQAGFLAVAAQIALQQNVERLAIDHQNAALLFERLKTLPESLLQVNSAATNMVFVSLNESIDVKDLTDYLAERGFVIAPERELRLVTHLDISESDVLAFVDALQNYSHKVC